MTPAEQEALRKLRAMGLSFLRGEVEYHLGQFRQSPAGIIFNEAGKRIIKARDEGKELTPNDLLELLKESPQIIAREKGHGDTDS